MDEAVMIAWVQDVLAPYFATAPVHVVPILILDMYRCHMMSSVVQMIQELGVEVQHIPGGCTSLCQPVDVGFNKPFKDRMRRQWINWMTNEGIVHGTTSPPARLDVAKWVQNGMLEMKGRRSVNKIANLIKFVFSIKFSITLKKSIANRLDDLIIYTCAIDCFK